MPLAIKTRKLTKIFHGGMPDEMVAVRDVSLEISHGHTTVLAGPSGSGKTTLLSLLGCMSRPTVGSVAVNGKDVAKLPERFLTAVRRGTFGFIFQQFNLVHGVSALENVMLPLYATATGFSEARKIALAKLESVELKGRANVKVQRLSGGEQQRVAIARALVNEPEIILADEPTAHLDTKLSEDFIGIMKKLKAEGKTIIIATHDPLVCDHPMIDRIVKMRDGNIFEASGK